MTEAAGPRGWTPVMHALVVVLASSSTAMALGFLKNVLSAAYFGTSGEMDAYLVALLLPDMAMQIARTGAFNFIPLFAQERLASEAGAWRLASQMLSYWLGLLLLTLFCVLVLSPLAAPLVAPGFVGARLATLLELTRVLLLMAACVGTSRLLAVVLHANRRFALAGLSEVVFQGISTAWLVAFHANGIASLAWAQVAGGVAQLLVVLFALRDKRRYLRPALPLSSGPARRFIRLSLPIYLGDSGDKLNLVVTRAFGSFLPAGGVAALQYAYMPVEAAYRTIAGSLATALFPFLSRRFATGDLRGARSSLARAGVGMAVVFAPLAVGFWVLADVLVVAVFERGSFDADSAAQTASALRLFAPSALALALNELIGSSFHARQDTVTPMRAGFVRVVINTLLCAGLTPSLGVRGLAAATTLSLFAKLLYLGTGLRGLYSAPELTRHLRQVGSVLLAAGLMGVLVSPVASLASTPAALSSYSWTSLLILGVLCLGGYAAALWMVARRQLLAFLALFRHAIRVRRRPRALELAA